MKKKYLFVLLIIALAVFLPRDSTFAEVAGSTCAEIATIDTANGIIGIIFDVLVRIWSWIWVIIATLAWQFMSNEWVYGSGIGIDKTLWTLWNYMKNIANFLIAFLFIYQIAKWVVGKDAFNIKALLPKILVSTVLVNMSWFIMGAAIDLSNIGTATIGAVPQAFFKNNKESEAQMKKLLATVSDTVKVQMECKQPVVSENKENTADKNYKLDLVWARFNDMSGPLMYMGMSIFRLQEFNFADEETANRSDLSMAWIIKIFILLMFLAPMIALLLINLKRVVYLRIVIIFSPLIIVFHEKFGMSKMPKIDGKVGWNNIGDLLSIKEVVGMIFAPVLTIAGMAITLILTSSMFYVLGGNPNATADKNTSISRVSVPLGQGASIARESQDTSSFTAPWTNIILQGDLFKDVADFAWGAVWYFILVTMSILLLRWILGITANTSKIAASTYDGVMKLGKSLVMGAKFIPMWWPGEKVSLWWLAWAPQALMDKYKGKQDAKTRAEIQRLSAKFGETGIWQLIQNSSGINFGETTDITNEIASQMWTNYQNDFPRYLWELKDKLKDWGQSKITVSSWELLKKLLTKYATTNINAIRELSSSWTKYNLTPKELKALSSFDGSNSDKLFDTTGDLWTAFVKVISMELNNKSLDGKITGSSILFASNSKTKTQSQSKDQATPAPEENPPSDGWENTSQGTE